MEAAMTTMTTQLATDFVVPTIHLGSFKAYRLPGDRTAATGNNDSRFQSNAYAQQLQHGSNSPLRSASAPYPNMQQHTSSQKPYTSKHPSLGSPISNAITAAAISSTAPTGSSALRMLPSPAAQVPTVSVQPANNLPQTLGPPRELCLECMMRDEDMADVDVTSPGVWDRDSDVWYHELLRREEEEERERNLHPSTSSGVSSSASCCRPRASGTKLTEGNLVAWLNLNPPEPASKQQTLFAYIDAQNAILAAENKARIQATQEARQLDEKMRESSPDSHRSPYDFIPENNFTDDPRNNVKRHDTSSQSPVSDSKKARKSRKASRDSLTRVDPNRERDAIQFYNLNGIINEAGGTSTTRVQTVYGSTTSFPTSPNNPSVIRSVQSMYMPNTASNWQQQQSSTSTTRPASMAPDVFPGFSSQTSLGSANASPRKRFFGLRQWSGYFGSNASLAQSGSMMDMHLGLDLDKHHIHIPHVDIGSKPPSLQEGTPWPYVDARQSLDNATDRSDSPKIKRGLGRRLWRMLSGGAVKSSQPVSQLHRHDLDEEPLAPPPPLSYLVNRGSMQSERSLSPLKNNRHASMPSLSFSNTSHPTTTSTPQAAKTTSVRSQMANLSSPSDQSSTLPSPTDIRSPNREGLSDVVFGICDDEFLDPKRKMDINPARTRSLSQNVVPTLVATNTGSLKSMSTQPSMIRTFSVDKNLPPLPTDEEPGTTVPTSASVTIPFLSTSNSAVASSTASRNIAMSTATLPAALQVQQQLQSYPKEYASSGYRYEEPIRRQSFNGLISRPNLPVGAGRASIPGLRQYAYDEFGNPILATGNRHSLAVGSVAGMQTLPNGAKRKHKLGLGSIFGRKQ